MWELPQKFKEYENIQYQTFVISVLNRCFLDSGTYGTILVKIIHSFFGGYKNPKGQNGLKGKYPLVKLRLQRTGTKHDPHCRIVAADSRSPRDGKFVDIVGHYHPAQIKEQTTFNKEKILTWLKNGAQPTGTVLNLFKNAGIWAEYKTTLKK